MISELFRLGLALRRVDTSGRCNNASLPVQLPHLEQHHNSNFDFVVHPKGTKGYSTVWDCVRVICPHNNERLPTLVLRQARV